MFIVHSHAGPITERPTIEDAAVWLIDIFETHDRVRGSGRILSPQYNPDVYFIEGPHGETWRVERDGRYFRSDSTDEEARRAPNVRDLAEGDLDRDAPICLDAPNF